MRARESSDDGLEQFGCTLTPCGIELPPNLSVEQWLTAFRKVGKQHSTATPALLSASNSAKALASAAAVGPSTALRTWGRSRMTVLTGPSRSTRTLTARPG